MIWILTNAYVKKKILVNKKWLVLYVTYELTLLISILERGALIHESNCKKNKGDVIITSKMLKNTKV